MVARSLVTWLRDVPIASKYARFKWSDKVLLASKKNFEYFGLVDSVMQSGSSIPASAPPNVPSNHILEQMS